MGFGCGPLGTDEEVAGGHVGEDLSQSGTRRSLRLAPSDIARFLACFRRLSVIGGRRFSEPADNRVQTWTQLLSQLGCQFALNPACLANGRPVHTTIHDRRWPTVYHKTYEIVANAVQNSL